MIYVPESHQHGLFEIEKVAEGPAHHIPNRTGPKLQDEVRCPVPAGSVIFHHSSTPHRSAVNRSNAWRRAHSFTMQLLTRASEIELLNQELSLEID